MDWERVLINVGVTTGFFALMVFWIGLAMWMRVDADKRGIPGWLWIFIGLLTGPLGLIAYILYRGNRPVLEVVHQRDKIIEENARLRTAVDYDPDAPAATPPAAPSISAIEAALEAEERRYRNNT